MSVYPFTLSQTQRKLKINSTEVYLKQKFCIFIIQGAIAGPQILGMLLVHELSQLKLTKISSSFPHANFIWTGQLEAAHRLQQIAYEGKIKVS